MRNLYRRVSLVLTFSVLMSAPVIGAGKSKFQIEKPGNVASGSGVADYTLYAPSLAFPFPKDVPTTLNSQVYSPGGGGYKGPHSGQCHESNYDEIWQDTLCETRGAKASDKIPLGCPKKTVHQGIDMRGGTTATCKQLVAKKKKVVPIVAVADGKIVYKGSYTVDLRTNDGRKFRYLHMDMNNLEASVGQTVQEGDQIGWMSNDFGGTPTTFHLHLEHWKNIKNVGIRPVPLYCDLVNAYSGLHNKDYDVIGGGKRCDGSVSQDPILEDKPPLGVDKLASFWNHNGSEMGLLAEGKRRALIYTKPRVALQGLVDVGDQFFDGEITSDNRYVGKARIFKKGCEPLAFEVEGPVSNNGLRVEVSGNQPRRDGGCKIIGSSSVTLSFVHLRNKGEQPSGTCDIADLDRKSLTEKTKNWGAITMYVPFENWLPYIKNWPGLRLDASGQPVNLGLDSKGGFIPALETDESGVGMWWYWLLVRKGYGANGEVTASATLRAIARGIAGSDASQAAIDNYLNAYLIFSGRYFAEPLGADDPIDIGEPDTRWALAQIMFHHEAGRAPLIDRVTFNRGIEFGKDYMKGQFKGVDFYRPQCVNDQLVGSLDSSNDTAETLDAKDIADSDVKAMLVALEKEQGKLQSENARLIKVTDQLNELISQMRERMTRIAEIAAE